jgi:hypothetical protein
MCTSSAYICRSEELCCLFGHVLPLNLMLTKIQRPYIALGSIVKPFGVKTCRCFLSFPCGGDGRVVARGWILTFV